MKVKRFSKVRQKNFGFLGKAAGTIGITASSLLKSPKNCYKTCKRNYTTESIDSN